MKTAIKTIIASALTVIALTTTTTAHAANSNNITTLSEVKKVNKIDVSGNVELILVQSADEHVNVYDSYFSKNALVQQKDGELRISSFNKETLTVVVYVSNLTSITASDNATVRTHGKFSTLSLAINLNDQASANLNTNTVALTTNVNDQSNITLSGSTENYDATMGSVAKVNMIQFVAQTSDVRAQNVIAKASVHQTQSSTTDALYNL